MFALKNAALMVTMTEDSDLGVAMSTNALELSGSTSEEVSLYFYDRYVQKRLCSVHRKRQT